MNAKNGFLNPPCAARCRYTAIVRAEIATVDPTARRRAEAPRHRSARALAAAVPSAQTLRRRSLPVLCLAFALIAGLASAQTRRPPVRRPPAKAAARPAAPVKAPADAACPAVLGTGVGTRRVFCDVLTATEAAGGIVIKVPPHRGPATLTFDLHNRHTYSEDEVRAKRAFARYTATVLIVAPDGAILDRAVVQNEFRTAADLYDRVSGGAGPSGVKAVAPTGVQPISLQIPEGLESISLVGEKVIVERADGTDTYTSPGRAIALVSNLQLEYRPGPPPRKRR
jgi:hypothetical protein